VNLTRVIETIKKRRSIRRFRGDDVSDDLLEKIVDAARWAPSGDNQQPWLFAIVKDVALKEQMQSFLCAKALRYIESDDGRKELEGIGPDVHRRWVEAVESRRYQEHLRKAPVLIATFGDVKSPFYVHDCCAATENLILAAEALGLGSCWTDHGIGDESLELQMRDLLKVPNNYRIVSLVAIGFPDETPKPKPRKDIAETVFLNQYGRNSELL
jgi:nitroreductase